MYDRQTAHNSYQPADKDAFLCLIIIIITSNLRVARLGSGRARGEFSDRDGLLDFSKRVCPTSGLEAQPVTSLIGVDWSRRS